MKLPASLAPWANILRIFPEEISLIFGGYAQKIAPFINPLNSVDANDDGEPDGYDGVARRGIYERLLLSELALADEFSEEFIRRAVMGEHLFLNPAKIAPSSKRISIAIFDAGAMQIGTPRIAHLAIFIVLARRAEAANAMFLWGVFQDAKQLVISDDTEASLKILLESRSPNDVTKDDIAAWREKLSDIPQTSDVWLIGDESLAQFAETKGFSHLYVEDVLEPQKHELSLKIKSASGIEKQITLELPPADVCTRLLRNPFETAKRSVFTSKNIGGDVTSFFFDQNGSKLFAKLNSFDVLSFDVQNGANDFGKMYPATYKQARLEKCIAAGNLRKAIAFLSLHDYQTLRLTYKKRGFNLKEGLYRIIKTSFAAPENDDDLLQIFSFRPKHFQHDEAVILDAKGNLFTFDDDSLDSEEGAEKLTGVVRVIANDVLAIAQTEREFVFVGRENNLDFHRIVTVSNGTERKEIPVKQIEQAFFGRGKNSKKVLAMKSSKGDWAILDENKDVVLHTIEHKGEVVGVQNDARFAPSVGLFELMDDRRTLELAWEHGRRKHILTASEDIAKIGFSPRSPILAYQTTSGELVIYSLTHRTAIGHYSK